MKIPNNDNSNQRQPYYVWGTMIASGITPYKTISQVKNDYGITFNKFVIVSLGGNTISCKRYTDGTVYNGYCAVVNGSDITLFNTDGTITTNMIYIYTSPYRNNVMGLI